MEGVEKSGGCKLEEGETAGRSVEGVRVFSGWGVYKVIPSVFTAVRYKKRNHFVQRFLQATFCLFYSLHQLIANLAVTALPDGFVWRRAKLTERTRP